MRQASNNDVRLVRWPAESEVRDRYKKAGVPCLLIVEGGAIPPLCSGPWEDWVRPPISQVDFETRVRALRVRAHDHKKPQVDPSGVIQFGSQSVTVSATQAELLEVFVSQFDRVVSRELLQRRLAGSGRCRPTRNSLDLHIMRLRRRIYPLNLTIRTAWGRGYVLEACSPAS